MNFSKPTKQKAFPQELTNATQQIESQKKKLLDELASDKTVRYIKRIEDENLHYQKELHAVTQRANSMAVSLNSANRLLAKLNTKPQTPKRPHTAKFWDYSKSERYSTLGTPMSINVAEFHAKRKGHTDRLYSSPVSGSKAMRPSSSYGSKASTTHFATRNHDNQLHHIKRASTSYGSRRGTRRNMAAKRLAMDAMGGLDDPRSHQTDFDGTANTFY